MPGRLVGRFATQGGKIERLGAVDSQALGWARAALALADGESSYAGKTSPHWYDSDAFFELLQPDSNLDI